jgi:hypothetical protein
MVKGPIKFVRNAHYESQQRTVDVSVKPAIGKSIFSEALIAAASGSFQGHFETERFVHKQVREYTLRAAAHCADVRAVLPDRKASALRSDSVVHTEHIKDIPESLKYRAAAETIDNSIGSIAVPEVPKQIRVYVLAKMLHDMDMPLDQFQGNSPAKAKVNDDRSNLKMRYALKRIARSAPVPLNTVDSERVHMLSKLVSSQASVTHGAGQFDSKGLLDSERADYKIWTQTRSAIVVLTLMSLLSKTKGVSRDSLNCSEAKTQYLKYGQRDSSVAKITGRQGCFETSKEEGFGTAPIWYQQSVENGPPEHSLAGLKA